MRPMKHLAPSLLAGLALVSAQGAQAQQACIEPADLDDTIRYAIPILYDATMTTCADQYAPDGFMMRDGEAFADSFRALQSEAWPGTVRVIQTFAAGDEEGDDLIASMLTAMPEDTLRPFVDTLVTQMVSEEIKPDTCGKIERALELIAPLPPENVSGLVTFIVEQVRPDDPQLCGIEPKKETAAE